MSYGISSQIVEVTTSGILLVYLFIVIYLPSAVDEKFEYLSDRTENKVKILPLEGDTLGRVYEYYMSKAKKGATKPSRMERQIWAKYERKR